MLYDVLTVLSEGPKLFPVVREKADILLSFLFDYADTLLSRKMVAVVS